VRSTLRAAGACVLGCLGAAGLTMDKEAVPSPPPARTRRARPIHDSIDRVVDRVVEARLKPCSVAARQGVPCFPVTLEQEGPRFSVAEALRRYRGVGSPAPGVPTRSEVQGQMSGAPQSASGGVGSDPVCSVKKLFGKLSGTTFYVYRTWDARGERPLLTDRELDPKAYAGNPAFRYELVGKYSGDCEAIAAWRKALREATAPEPLPDDWDEPAESPPP
jgi:hypothetical protein